MIEPPQTDLVKVIESLRETPVSESSMRRALDRAKQIDCDIMEARPASVTSGHDRKVRRLRMRRTTAAILATSAAAAMALFAWNRHAAYAQLPEILSGIERVHLVIRSSDQQDQGIEIWFQRGAGFAMHGPVGMEIDDGETYWNYFSSRKLAIRSESRLGEGRFTDVQQLGKTMGFHVDELPPSLARLPEEDRSVDGTQCKAFVWNQESLGPLPENLKAIEEMWPDRRLVFLLDGRNRLRSCRHERGLEGRWKTYRTMDADYPEQIAQDRFAPRFDDDVKVVDADSSEMSIDPHVVALVEGVRRRHATYRDVEFKLAVTADVKASPDSQFPGYSESVTNGVRKTTEMLAIMSPTPERPDRPWRRWIQTQTDESGTSSLLRFAAFDGEQSKQYRTGKTGQVLPGELWNWFHDDWFQELLFLGINGVSNINPMAEDVRNIHLNRMHVTDRRTSGDIEIVTVLGSSSAEFGMEYRVEMTTEPDYMILLWEARYARANNQLVGRYAVTDIGEFEGIRYPSKGSYRQMPLRELPDITYAFEVAGCERLDEDDREDWFPDWPAGIIVQDQVSGQNYQVQ